MYKHTYNVYISLNMIDVRSLVLVYIHTLSNNNTSNNDEFFFCKINYMRTSAKASITRCAGAVKSIPYNKKVHRYMSNARACKKSRNLCWMNQLTFIFVCERSSSL